jgi:3-deoxy-D-manno-octulosonic-acid transferase
MTADVPSSQPRIAGDGIIALARLSGRPIIPLAAATSRYITLDTWSKLTINLPFSTLAIVAGDPIFVPAEATETELENARLDVERSLNAATARAYDIAKAGKARQRPREANTTAQRSRQ